jgi:peptidoglycan lytic transglycosylase
MTRRSAFFFAVLMLWAAPALAKSDLKAKEGIASTYAARFVGHTTASGQVLDRHRLTAAHKRLPFGTKLVVTNKRNGRHVVVTVNDRGPYRKGRIIDLSPAAAKELGMYRAGLAPVELRLASQD